MFGQLSNDNAIRANMEGCDDVLAVGEHDLYCTTKTADNCYVFDGADDGKAVLEDFSSLLEAAIVFKVFVLFGVFVYTFCTLFAIMDMHYFRDNKVYIEDGGAEMLRLAREEQKTDGSNSLNSKKTKTSNSKSSNRPPSVSDSELLGY